MDFALQDVLRRVEAWQRYLRRREKPLWVNEIGTFHYGWRENNPSGCSGIDACLTVAEAVLRLVGQGARAFNLWQLFDSDDNDGSWSALAWEGGTWRRQGHKHAVYGTLSRALRPGSRLWTLSAEPSSNLSPVHGVAVLEPGGTRRLVLLNDDPVHNWSVALALPAGFEGLKWKGEITDRAKLNAPWVGGQAVGSRLELGLPSFSLVGMEGTDPD